MRRNGGREKGEGGGERTPRKRQFFPLFLPLLPHRPPFSRRGRGSRLRKIIQFSERGEATGCSSPVFTVFNYAPPRLASPRPASLARAFCRRCPPDKGACFHGYFTARRGNSYDECRTTRSGAQLSNPDTFPFLPPISPRTKVIQFLGNPFSAPSTNVTGWG